MAMRTLMILKIGGSVLTDKRKKTPELREENLRLLGQSLKTLWPKPLIIVHGAGTYGHLLAKEYGLTNGYKDPRSLEGFIKTSSSMRLLNNRVVEVLNDAGLPCIGIPAGIVFRTRRGTIETISLDPFLASLDIGIVPVTCGDVTFDSHLKFTVLSGDTIAVYFAKKLSAKTLVFATDVDGVYEFRNNERRLIKELKRGYHYKIQYRDVGDVTGGMAYKVETAYEAVEAGVDVRIVNGNYPDRVIEALLGNPTTGTKLTI
ncbi:MAG: isopentenyl phosphate kinase [Nitrososphaerota archaeon]